MIEETCRKSVKIDVGGAGGSGGTRGGVFIGIAENDDDVYTCMKCQKDDVREMDGNIFCNSCGIFICHKLTCNAEFHTYFNDDKSADQTRCGLPTNSLIPESSLGTIMLTRGGTGGRRTGGAAGAMEMQRLRRTHNYNQMTPRDRNRYRRMERIKLIGKHMNLADIIIHDAQHYYTRLVAKREVLRGTNK
jgi:transcription initiation factor TFIIB